MCVFTPGKVTLVCAKGCLPNTYTVDQWLETTNTSGHFIRMFYKIVVDNIYQDINEMIYLKSYTAQGEMERKYNMSALLTKLVNH